MKSEVQEVKNPIEWSESKVAHADDMHDNPVSFSRFELKINWVSYHFLLENELSRAEKVSIRIPSEWGTKISIQK